MTEVDKLDYRQSSIKTQGKYKSTHGKKSRKIMLTVEASVKTQDKGKCDSTNPVCAAFSIA